MVDQLQKVLTVWPKVPLTPEYKVCGLPSNTSNATTCLSRQPASTLLTDANGTAVTIPLINPTGCVIKQGWLRPVFWPPQTPDSFEFSPACPRYPELTYTNITFDKPEHLTMWWPDIDGYLAGLPPRQRQARQVMTSVIAAADSIWESAQIAYGITLGFHNVSSSDLPRLRKLYKNESSGVDEWNPVWTSWMRAGNLIELDYTYMEGITSGDRWTVAAHVVLRYFIVQGQPKVRAVAVRLSNIEGSPQDFQVYTPEKSKSAFIQACMLARSAVYFSAGHMGHFYSQHMMQSGLTYALYNTMDPLVPMFDSNHPVRMLIDHYASPLLQAQWNMLYMANSLPPTPTSCCIGNNDLLLSFLERFAERGYLPGTNSYYNMMIPQLMRRSGLNPAKFTSPGGKPFDLYPQARFALDLYDITYNFTVAYVNAYYPTDRLIANDQPIQTWVAAMLEPLGGNLRQVTATNTIKTKQDLIDVLCHALLQTVLHPMLNYQDYTIGKNSLAWLPFAPKINYLFDPTANYTTAQIVAAAADAGVYAKQMNFNTYMEHTYSASPYQWVPYKCPNGVCPPQFARDAIPDYEADLPFNGSTAAGKTVNDAVITFRKQVPYYLATTNYTRGLWSTTDPDRMAVLFVNYLTN